MFARLIDIVKFDFKMKDDSKEYNLASGGGKLYITDDGLLLSDGSSWYEIPLKEVNEIRDLNHDSPSLLLNISGMNVFIHGSKANILSALRHYLLPYVG
ncbi:MAG: hypothetical protein R6W73_00155 [Candidatus Saliniplasma sp.]